MSQNRQFGNWDLTKAIDNTLSIINWEDSYSVETVGSLYLVDKALVHDSYICFKIVDMLWDDDQSRICVYLVYKLSVNVRSAV